MPRFSLLPKLLLAATLAVTVSTSYAIDVSARIRGTVTDTTGAAIPNAVVIATNSATGVKFNATSGANGSYFFPHLPIGTYSVSASAPCFKSFNATGIMLNIDQEFVEPVQLSVGNTSETVSVQADAVQVNTTDMQLNNIVDSHQIRELPLIGRDFTQLEQTLPGVQAASDRFGTFSVNGSQAQQSAYVINGADSNDLPLNTPAIRPNLDALAQFNLVTGPLNAEYDRNSGAVVNTAIIQGTNAFHGDVFEFYRDTFLNTRNFFQKVAPTPPYHQNIFGGTIGGPILRDKLFFFGAYQGTRQRTPESGGNVTVFSPAQLAGNFSNATLTPANSALNPDGTLVDPTTGRIPASLTIPGCTAGEAYTDCFKNNQVPVSAFNPISAQLVKQYVPAPNSGTNGYQFNPTVNNKADQGIGRFDFNPTSKNQFYFVGIYQNSVTSETLPFTGATLPGFGDKSTTVIHQFSAGYTRTINSTLVNDFQVHYTRFNFDAVEPQNIVQPSSLGFSITPQNAAAASVPTINITGADATQPNVTLGFSTNGPQPRLDQVYQIDDNLSKTLGHHTLKFGYDGRKYTVENPFYSRNSGSFTFTTASNADTTGDAGLDFLLGIPASYNQGSGARIDAHAFLNYIYGQDTWKATQDLTISYGLGYQIDSPLHNTQYKGIGVTCFIPGQQSKVFSTAPVGLNYPGDPGCNDASGATTFYKGLGPRIGFAYAPNLGWLSDGDQKKLSIRAGYGIYYNRTEEETSLNNLGAPPFGLSSGGATDYGTASNPGFANPYQDLNIAGAAGATPSKFPFVPPVAGASPNFTTYLPFSLSQYAPGFRSPYSENFQLSLEREFPSRIVARMSYVGSLGRHNQVVIEGNPITPAGHDACLADPTCGGNTSNRNAQSFRYPTHTQYGYAYAPLGNSPVKQGLNPFTSIGLVSTSGTSNYNSLQIGVQKDTTYGLQFQASYTLSHSLDDASSYEGSGYGGSRGYNQYDTRLNYGNSSFDARHRFVFSPVYTVPFRSGSNAFSPLTLLLSGWQISGIATFATGFPFDISYGGGTSRSLWCSASYSFYACPDVPQQIAPLVKGNLRVLKANKSTFFAGGATGSFAPEPLGGFGNISRNKYYGPGINNTNLILAKNFALSTESPRSLQLRMESDNVFNHTQFANPTSNITSGNFGLITSAAAGRQTQLAAKIYF